MKVHIRRNDEVEVIAGTSKGQRGKVLRVYPSKKSAIVERVNMIKRHTRPNPSRNVKGGVVEREGAIHVSNLRLLERGTVEGRAETKETAASKKKASKKKTASKKKAEAKA